MDIGRDDDVIEGVEETEWVFIWSDRGIVVDQVWFIMMEGLSAWIRGIPGGGVINVVRLDAV